MIFYLPWLYDEDIEGSGTPRCVTVELALSYPFSVSLETEDGLDVELETEDGLEITLGGLCSRQ